MLKKSEEISSSEQLENPVEKDVRQSVLGKTEEMLVIMRNNEKLTKEILKSVRFIKNYYFWRSALSIFKYLLLAGIVILGIVSWDNIIDFINTGMNSYVGTRIPGTIDPATINTFLR